MQCASGVNKDSAMIQSSSRRLSLQAKSQHHILNLRTIQPCVAGFVRNRRRAKRNDLQDVLADYVKRTAGMP